MSDQKIVEFINTSFASGKKKEEIYTELLTQGYSIDAIQSGFEEISASQNKVDSSKNTIKMVTMFGVTFVGIGVFSIIAANWSYLDDFAKLICVIVPMCISYIVGANMRKSVDHQKTGDGLIVLGTVFYGAAIFLIAQIFNIHAMWQDGMLLWTIGSALAALLTAVETLYVFTLMLSFVAVIGHSFGVFLPEAQGFYGLSNMLLVITTCIIVLVGIALRKKALVDLSEYY
jgi:uncharacterized membrane protein